VALLTTLIVVSIGGGYLAGIQPDFQWRFFSWHPFLMTCSMVGLAGMGVVTKKLGGYTNTKLHAMLGWSAIFTAVTGLYCIYRNKELNGKSHLTTVHSWFGIGVFMSVVGLGLAGSVFLHPDFGIDKVCYCCLYIETSGKDFPF
jgi:hypothetical protein